MRTHLSLFSGIGGLDLAAEWAGFTTVGQCEFADFPTKVLEKHWPEVPRWRDIRTLTGEDFYARTGLRTVDIISGGFPCQPFSVAGNQKGKEDDRYLWPEMLRVIRELAPSWIVGENVPGILHIAADDVCKDLEREGYKVGIFDFEAAAVGAKHRRERFFFVGHTKHDGRASEQELRSNETTGDNRRKEEQEKTGELARTDRPLDVSSVQGRKHRSEHEGTSHTGSNGNVADTDRLRMERTRAEQQAAGISGKSKVVADTMRVGGTAGTANTEAGQEGQATEFNNGGDAMANADCIGHIRQTSGNPARHEERYNPSYKRSRGTKLHETVAGCENAPNTNHKRLQVARLKCRIKPIPTEIRTKLSGRRPIKSRLGGMVDGLSPWLDEPDGIPRIAVGIKNRVDRLKSLGNAVVPQQAYPIFKAIYEIMEGLNETNT